MTTGDAIDLEELVEPRDREHVARIADAAERKVVVSALVRHRRAEPARAGGPLPALDLHRAEGEGTVRLRDLVQGRPLVLVFGSYT